MKRQAYGMDSSLVVTHLGAAIGGVLIGLALCRSRHLR